MRTMSLNKLGGMALFLGPLLALIFFLIQPSGLFIASADPSDAMATIDSLAGNVALTKLTVLLIAVGLIWTTFGIYVLQSNLRGDDGDSLTRIGLAGIGIGTIGWITAQGLNLVMADATSADAVQVAESVFAVRLGITLLSGVGISLGFLVFSLGIATREDFNKIAALIAAAASVVALIGFVIAVADSGMTATGFTISRVCYLFWTAWAVHLGWGLLKRPMSE